MAVLEKARTLLDLRIGLGFGLESMSVLRLADDEVEAPVGSLLLLEDLKAETAILLLVTVAFPYPISRNWASQNGRKSSPIHLRYHVSLDYRGCWLVMSKLLDLPQVLT